MTVVTERVYDFAGFRVNPREHQVLKDGNALRVEPKAFKVLLFLIENRGRLIQKDELINAVWRDTFVTDNALTRAIAHLRKVLDDDVHTAKYIETVPTQGYRFIADVNVLDNGAAKSQPRPAHPPVDHVSGGAMTGHWTRVAVVIAVGLLLLVAGFILWGRKRSEPLSLQSRLRPVQVTSSSGLDIYPTFSPDGSAIAYSSDRSGDFEIYIRQLAPGGEDLQLTSDGGGNLEPAWSSDGRWIAYHSRHSGGIWLIPSLGGSPRRLTQFGSRPSWSPDGRFIAFQSAEIVAYDLVAPGAIAPSTVWVVPFGGGAPVQITRSGNPSGGHNSPSWSPDASKIIFVSTDKEGSIWSISIDSNGNQVEARGSPKAIAEYGAFLNAVYSSSGDTIYYSDISPGLRFGLWRDTVTPQGNLAGHPVLLLMSTTAASKYLALSANGKSIAYTAVSGTSNIYSLPISLATGTPTAEPGAVTHDTRIRKALPQFSPDGKKIAFAVWRTGAGDDLWIVNADGTNPQQITSRCDHPNWTPDGACILCVTCIDCAKPERRPLSQLMSVRLSDHTQTDLMQSHHPMGFIRVSHDGKRIAFNTINQGITNLWSSSIDKDDATQLTFDSELAGFAAWSPDDKWIALELKRGADTHLAVMPSNGGQITELTHGPGQAFPHDWSPDGDRILFAGERDGIWNLYWISRSTGKQQQLTHNNGRNNYLRYPSWSSRGDEIVYEFTEMFGNIWTVDIEQ